MSSSFKINYRTEPQIFSNTSIIHETIIMNVCTGLIELRHINAENLLSLAILVESVVLNEKIIICTDSDFYPKREQYSDLTEETIKLFYDNKIAAYVGESRNGNDSIANNLISEIALLTQPHPGTVINVAKDKKTLYYNNINVSKRVSLEEYNRQWMERAIETWNPEYISFLQEAGYFKSAETASYDKQGHVRGLDWNSVSPPWSILAKLHAIPYISDNYYTLRDFPLDMPISASHYAYHKLEELRMSRRNVMKNLYSVTYIVLPGLMSMVLQNCKKLEDIPNSMLEIRDKFSKLRKEWTKLDFRLRTADTEGDEDKIIHEFIINHNEITKKYNENKTRLIYEGAKIASNLFEGLINNLSDIGEKEYRLNLITGYYNLFKAMDDIQPGSRILEKLGLEISSHDIEILDKKMESLKKRYSF